MKIKLIPYCTIDGLWTFKDSQVIAFFNRMVQDGTAETVFYSGEITTGEAFLREMKSPRSFLYVAFSDGIPAGLTWVNGFEGKSARNHFCVFSDFWGQSLELGKAGMKFLTHLKTGNGPYLFDVLIGRIPEWNTHAIDFAIKCGCKRLSDSLPNAIWNAKTKRSEPAVIIYYTRDEALK